MAKETKTVENAENTGAQSTYTVEQLKKTKRFQKDIYLLELLDPNVSYTVTEVETKLNQIRNSGVK